VKNRIRFDILIFAVLAILSACGQSGLRTQETTPKQSQAADLPLNEQEKSQLRLDGNFDVIEEGRIIPTIYYFPVFNEDKQGCATGEKKTMFSHRGQVLMTVCGRTFRACLMEGSCKIIQNGVAHDVNYSGQRQNQYQFDYIDNGCKYGRGIAGYCLDPYYTVAADPNLYRPGDVIYVPAVKGLKLPNGQTHSGFFIVRDTGSAIRGKGRFDFFSGLQGPSEGQNPFVLLGLHGKIVKFPYMRIVGARADQVRTTRAFPRTPVTE
jgi:3D (Asp-Asp-Asp) domain-containing protein